MTKLYWWKKEQSLKMRKLQLTSIITFTTKVRELTLKNSVSQINCLVPPLVNVIRKYENHSSIFKIKSSVETTQLFDFNFDFNSDDISIIIINSLDPTKKMSGAIPTKTV